MSDVIKLFNPNDKPFGKLSNNAYHPMTLNGKKYPTVTNYIFSNMLTTPTFKEIMRNAEIKGSSKLNQELMTAIDFLIEKQKTSKLGNLLKVDQETDTLLPSTESISMDKMVQTIIENTDYTQNDIYGDKKLPEHLRKKWSLARIFEEYNKVEDARVYEEGGGDQTQKIWDEYINSGKLNKSRKEIEEQQKYMRVISNEVRKPFETINLVELKQKLLAESEMNQIGIYQLYDKYVNEEIFNVLKVAVEKGYKSRFERTDMAELLLSTGNSPIQYESYDKFLGIGPDGKGSNLVGITLMQIRHNIRVRKTQEERKQQEIKHYKHIYDTYIAYTILKKEMFNNKKRLDEYLGLNPSQIIEKYGLENILEGIPSQDTIIKLYKRDRLNDIIMKEIFQPGTLVINVRKNGIRQLREQLLRDKKDIIFNSYLAYIIRRKKVDELDEEVTRIQKIQDQIEKDNKGLKRDHQSKQQIEDNVLYDIITEQKMQISGEKLEKMKARVIDLFNLGMLSSSLSDKIDSDIEDLNIPTDEDVMDIEITEIPAPEIIPIPEIIEEKGDVSSSHSSKSEESSDPVENYLKQVFKSEKTRQKDLIEMIIKIKGGTFKDYKKMSEKELKKMLDGLEIEQLTNKEEKQVINPPSIEGGMFVQPSGQPIGIFKEIQQNRPEYRPFAPEEFTGMLEIENRFYPTIQHYIIAKLIASTGVRRKVDSFGVGSFVKGIGINAAYPLIMVNPPKLTSRWDLNPKHILAKDVFNKRIDEKEASDILLRVNKAKEKALEINKELSDPKSKGIKPQDFLTIELAGEVYDKSNDQANSLLLPLYAVTALVEKFADISMQNLLILTGNKEIKWMSPHNLYLGAGSDKNPGNNYIGKTMMEIREKLKELRSHEKQVSIRPEDLISFIKSDSFVMAWVEMRIKDMCGVVYKIQQYLKIKEGLNFDMSQDEDFQRLIVFILDELYQPCNDLIELSSKDETSVPDFIIRLVRKCSGMSTGTQPLKKLTISGEYVWNNEIKEKISENARRILKLDEEFWGLSRLDRTQSEWRKFNEEQLMEWTDFWEKLNESNMSIKQKKKEVARLKDQQSEEYNAFWGINKEKKSKDDISRHEHEKNQIKEELRQELSRLKRVELENNLVFRQISQIYWNRIKVMLNALILNLKPATGATIRDVLVKVEELNSEVTKCTRIVINEEDNCIISAILNLLVGIHKMKRRFSPTLELDQDDVELAGSIIINSKLQITNINIEEEVELSEIESEPEEFNVGEQGVFPQDIEDIEEEEQVDYEDNPYFEFKTAKHKVKQQISVDADLASVEQQVILIDPVNSKIIAEAIMKMVRTIKSHRMSDKIKQNRINFFATIR